MRYSERAVTTGAIDGSCRAHTCLSGLFKTPSWEQQLEESAFVLRLILYTITKGDSILMHSEFADHRGPAANGSFDGYLKES